MAWEGWAGSDHQCADPGGGGVPRWRKGKEGRKGGSTAKRKAMSDIRGKYFTEYSALVVKYGGKKPKPKA